MTEVRMKNIFRINIHPNRMGDSDSEVKQLFLNAKPRRFKFGGSKIPIFFFFLFGFFLLYPYIAPPFCNLSFYYKLAEVPGVARGI